MSQLEPKPLPQPWVFATAGAAVLIGYGLFFMREPLKSTLEICGRALSSVVELPADLTNQVLIESLLFFGTVLFWMFATTLIIYRANPVRQLLWAGLAGGAGSLGLSLLAQVFSWFWPTPQINLAALVSLPALFNQTVTAAFVACLIVLLNERTKILHPSP